MAQYKDRTALHQFFKNENVHFDGSFSNELRPTPQLVECGF